MLFKYREGKEESFITMPVNVEGFNSLEGALKSKLMGETISTKIARVVSHKPTSIYSMML